jgi:hypothetical protein
MKKNNLLLLFAIFLFSVSLYGCGLSKNRAKEIVEEVDKGFYDYQTPAFTIEIKKMIPPGGNYSLYIAGSQSEQLEIEFVNWLYEKKYVTSKNVTYNTYRTGGTRIDFDGQFTPNGLEYFNRDPNISPLETYGGIPLGYKFKFSKIVDYEIRDITIIDKSAEIKYTRKYEWVDSDYTRDLKNGILKNTPFPSRISTTRAIKSDNKGWIKS